MATGEFRMTGSFLTVQFCVILLHDFVIGIGPGIIGPSLPDFRCLFSVDRPTISFLLLWQGLGAILFQLASLYLLPRVHPYLLICICSSLLCLSLSLLPLVNNIYAADAAIFVVGGTTELGFTGTFHTVNLLWPGKQRHIHSLMTATSIGSMVAPLCLYPFLSTGHVTQAWRQNPANTSVFIAVARNEENSRLNVSENWRIDQKSITGPLKQNHSNVSAGWQHYKNNFTESLTHMDSTCNGFFSLIHIPYMFLSLIGIPAIIATIMFLLKSRNGTVVEYLKMDDSPKDVTNQSRCCVLLMIVYLANAQGFFPAFASLLTTYGTLSPLQNDVSTLSQMTSAFLSSMLLGRLLPVFFLEGFKQTIIISVCLTGILLGVILLHLAQWSIVILWTCCLLLGFFSGPLVASGLCLSSQIINMTPTVTALYMIAISCGFIFPYICAGFISVLGYQGFPIFNLVLFLLLIVSYMLILLLNDQAN